MSTQINNTGLKGFIAGEDLEAYRRVKLDSTGKAVYADAFDVSIGVTDDKVKSGETVTVRLHGFPGTRIFICLTSCAAGATLYGADDGKVDDTYAGTGLQEGVALEACTGANGQVEALPSKGGVELLHQILAQSDAGGTGIATEFTFSNGSVSLPAGQLKTGDLLRIKARGTLPATNGADTFTGKIKVGTEVIATSPAPDAVNGDEFILEAEVTVRESSATGKLEGFGRVLNDALAAGLDLPFGKAEAGEDTTGAIPISVTGQFNAASGGNEARLQHFTVERIRK